MNTRVEAKQESAGRDADAHPAEAEAAHAIHGGARQKCVGTRMDVTEQEQLTEELRRSEFYLAEGQRLAHAGSWSFKPDLTCDYWSSELYEILGFDPQKGIPTISDYFTRVHPEDREVVEATIRHMIAAGEGCDLKKRIIRPDGVQRVIRCVGMTVRENGVVTRFVGTLMDITEQEALTQELRRSEANLAEAQKLTHIGSWTRNPATGEFFYCSEEMLRIFEWDPQQGLPTIEMIMQRIHPDDRNQMQRKNQNARHQKTDYANDFRIVLPGGTMKFIHSQTHIAFSETGEVVEWFGTVMDVTERKKAEEAIRCSEAYLAEAQRLSRTGSWAWSPATGDIRYWSEECYRLLGFDPAGPLPHFDGFFHRIHPDDQAATRERFEKAIRDKVDFELDYRIIHPDKRVMDIHAVGHAVHDQAGELVEFVGTVIDVTERKRAEALLTGERSLHEMIATGVPLKEILNDLCLMIEEQRSGTLASVLLLGPDGIHLETLAGPGLPEGWKRQMASLPIGPCAGSCGTAAYRGSPVIVSDIATDPLWAVDHRASALSHGLRASWSYPMLLSGGKVLGTFCLYYREPRSPSPGDLNLIELAAHLARVAIERKEAEEQLRRSEAFLAEGQRLSHTGSWGWNASTGKLTWSQEHFRILGLDPQATTPSLAVFWERVHPDDRTALRRTFESAIQEKRKFEQEFRIVTPDWSIRHVHGVGHAILNKENEFVEFIGSTMDITERKRAEERAQSHDEAVRLALNAFVEELDVDRFLEHIITGFTKQFEATSSELWLFDGNTQFASLHMSCHQGKVIGAEAVRREAGSAHVKWRPSKVGRIPKIIDLPAQKSLLQPARFESLKNLGIHTLVVVPLVLGEQNLGFIELHFQVATRLTPDDLNHAQALVHHATLALQLSRLAHRTEQMAVMEERNRMAREIHDTLAQAFAGVVLHAEALGSSLEGSKARSRKSLLNIQKLARSGLEEARRSVQALRPKALDDRSLTQALEEAAKRLSEDAKLSCEFKQRGKALEMPVEVQNELFRVAQEAMTNVRKHARAKSALINLEFKGRRVILTIRDNGVGLAATNSSKRKQGYGLATMRERTQRIGGKLEVESPARGGTTIHVEVPLAKKVERSNRGI